MAPLAESQHTHTGDRHMNTISRVFNTQMLTSRGNPAKDQRIQTIQTSNYGELTQFYSYDTLIAETNNKGEVVLGSYWEFSATTGKYRNDFLGEGIAETRKKIDSGEYQMVDSTRSTDCLRNLLSTEQIESAAKAKEPKPNPVTTPVDYDGQYA